MPPLNFALVQDCTIPNHGTVLFDWHMDLILSEGSVTLMVMILLIQMIVHWGMNFPLKSNRLDSGFISVLEQGGKL